MTISMYTSIKKIGDGECHPFFQILIDQLISKGLLFTPFTSHAEKATDWDFRKWVETLDLVAAAPLNVNRLLFPGVTNVNENDGVHITEFNQFYCVVKYPKEIIFRVGTRTTLVSSSDPLRAISEYLMAQGYYIKG
jgi:hypothetical protein